MKYAWIENDKIRDILHEGTPEESYHPEVAVFYNTLVPDESVNGDGWVNGQLIPVPPPPVYTHPTTCSIGQLREKLTLADKTKWDNNSTPEIVTAKLEFQSPQLQEYTTEILDALVSSNSISQASKDKVLEIFAVS